MRIGRLSFGPCGTGAVSTTAVAAVLAVVMARHVAATDIKIPCVFGAATLEEARGAYKLRPRREACPGAVCGRYDRIAPRAPGRPIAPLCRRLAHGCGVDAHRPARSTSLGQ